MTLKSAVWRALPMFVRGSPVRQLSKVQTAVRNTRQIPGSA
jgi:hypothetical protein